MASRIVAPAWSGKPASICLALWFAVGLREAEKSRTKTLDPETGPRAGRLGGASALGEVGKPSA